MSLLTLIAVVVSSTTNKLTHPSNADSIFGKHLLISKSYFLACLVAEVGIFRLIQEAVQQCGPGRPERPPRGRYFRGHVWSTPIHPYRGGGVNSATPDTTLNKTSRVGCIHMTCYQSFLWQSMPFYQGRNHLSRFVCPHSWSILTMEIIVDLQLKSSYLLTTVVIQVGYIYSTLSLITFVIDEICFGIATDLQIEDGLGVI